MYHVEANVVEVLLLFLLVPFNSNSRVFTRYGGHISAALVLGGVDLEGSHIYTIYPHGSSDKLPYVTMGSGSLAAMSIFESEYRDDMEVRHFQDFDTDANNGCLDRASGFLFDFLL